MAYILLIAGARCGGSIYQLIQAKDLSQHLVGSILLEPTNALPHALLVYAILTSRWRWVDPAVLLCSIFSFASQLSWMMSDPASSSALLQSQDGCGASMDSWLASSCMCAAAHFTFNLLFKYGVLTALAWIVVAPGMAHHMPADVHAWPLVGAMVIISLLQLSWDLKARSLHKDVYYPSPESPEAGAPAHVEEPRGGGIVGEPRAGEILDLLQEGNCSTSHQATVLPLQASKSSLLAHCCELFSGLEERCIDAAAPFEEPTNEVSKLHKSYLIEEISSSANLVSDLETCDSVDMVNSGANQAAAMPMHYTTTTTTMSHEADVAASAEHPTNEVNYLQTNDFNDEISSDANLISVLEADVDAPVEDPTDELSDEEIYEMIDAINNGTYGALATPNHHTVWLRIPDADPDDLAPDAKIKLKDKFELDNPGYVVTDVVFLRGSLLVGVRIRPDGSSGADASAALVMKASTHCSWLAWLGLPTHMDMSMKVNIPSERQTSLLAAFSLAVTVPKSEEGVRIVSLTLRCSELPSGVAIKASLGNHILVCNVIQAGIKDVSSGSPTNGQGCITLQIKLPIDSLLCESSCWVLNVIVQDLDDHVIIGDRKVVLFDEALAEMAPELCSMRLLRPQDMPHSLRSPGVDQPWGAEVVYTLGLWLQTLHTERQLADSGLETEPGTADHNVILQQLADMWRAGNHLLMHLVGNGCKDSAKHVMDLLLNSPALRTCVHGKELGEGLDAVSSFHDFISGTHNTKGCTIMHLAVLSGSYAMVDEVIHWADAYSVPCQWGAWDKVGMTPLHVAVLVKEGDMARFLLKKGDSALLQAWQCGDGRKAKSAEHFSRRMAKVTAIARSGFNQQGRTRTGIQSLSRQRPHRMAGQTTSPLPQSPNFAQPSQAKPSSLGVAVLHKWSLSMKQLWSSLEPSPDANLEKKFIMYQMDKMSTAMQVLCSFQVLSQLMVFVKGGLGFLSLHAIVVLGCLTVPTFWAFYTRDYLVAEKLLFAWALWRKAFFHHIHCHGCIPFVAIQLLICRAVRAVAEPLRFRWSITENLVLLALNCILPDGLPLHWILLSHILGLLVSVAVEIRDRQMFMSLEKAK